MTVELKYKPDFAKVMERFGAWWHCEIIDRPVVAMTLPKPELLMPWPSPNHATLRKRWMDAEYAAEMALASVVNTEFLGDALPHAYPNLGPEVFSAFFGCELEFGEHTSWSIPMLKDWSEADTIAPDRDNVYWKKIIEITDALLEVGRNRFYTGITDLHPGGDAVAAFRDPVQLNYDMIEAPQQVKALVDRITAIYPELYDFYYERLRTAGQAISTWTGIVSTKRWLVPSNDFSCMVSPGMFREIFLPSIVAECRHYEASIYHLDGPGALKHLDALLDIKELNAIQWVCGAGHGRPSDWMEVYRKCQTAGKGIQILGMGVDELEAFMDNLNPEGVWIDLVGLRDRAEAEAVLRKLANWKRH